MPSAYGVAQYITDLRAIRSTGSATAETSFYPPLDRLLNTAGQKLKPAVLFSTQLRNQGAGMPDGGFFPQTASRRRNAEPPILQNPERGVVEIKPADYNLDILTNEPQTIRYLKQYGLVLITNLREFRLLQLTSAGTTQTLERYTLAATLAALWDDPLTRFARHADLLPDFLARVMLYRAPLVQPRDVAWLLASYAREARARAEDHPLGSFGTVKLALQESLGIQFEGEKGEHFFRSTLVQTLFYGIFSAWILWRRVPENRTPGARFDWRVSAHYLRVPVLRKLFGEVSDPGALNSVQLQEILNLAGEALNRVQPAFFDTFREEEAVAYFYEPFLEAFDPELRKDLGVWIPQKKSSATWSSASIIFSEPNSINLSVSPAPSSASSIPVAALEPISPQFYIAFIRPCLKMPPTIPRSFRMLSAPSRFREFSASRSCPRPLSFRTFRSPHFWRQLALLSPTIIAPGFI